MKQIYKITGMGCSACQAAVEKAVKNLNGITSVNVSLIENSMTVVYEEKRLDGKDIIKAVKKAGYGAELESEETGSSGLCIEPSEKTLKERLSKDAALRRFVVSLILLIPLVYLNFAAMYSLVQPVDLSPYLQFILALCILVVNREYFVRGARSIINRAPGMDALISIGALTAFLYSVYRIVKNIVSAGTLFYTSVLNRSNPDSMGNSPECMYFFESAGMIFTIITLGKMLESKSKAHTMDAIGNLVSLSPKTAAVLEAGVEKTVKVSELKPGDIVLVRMGERVPADGEIVEGEGTFDSSSLTGESLPVDSGAGMQIMSGSLCLDGFVKIKVNKAGKDTTLSRIIELVREAGAAKAPIQRLADTISGYFVPIILSISAITLIVWLILGYGFDFSLNMAISVMVISCPCALGLATPTAIMAGTGNAALHGILIRSAQCLETAKDITTVILDKTGTVTEGNMSVTDVYTVDGEDVSKFVFMAAVLETVSSHPYAKAVKMYALNSFSPNELMEFKAVDAKTVSGGGISASIDGERWYAGNERLLADNGIDYSKLETKAQMLRNHGKSVLFFATDKLKGIIAVADAVKQDSIEAVQEMKKNGLKVMLVTGDNASTAASIGAQLGIDSILSGVFPEDKDREVKKLIAAGEKVAMVGDGVNDAPALVSSDVGIAIGGGTEVAIDAADFILMRNSVKDVAYIFSLSNRVIGNIKQNLFWAFFYNCVSIPIAAGVLYLPLGLKLTPGLSVACMCLSSLFVVTNALKLRK